MWKQALAIFVPSASASQAQADRGTITGTVADQTSAPVPNARVSATNARTGVNCPTQTTESGNYYVPQLPAGTYDLTASAPSFRRVAWHNVEVIVAQTFELRELRQVEQSIEVSAAAPCWPDVIAGGERALTHESFDPATNRRTNPDAFAPATGMRFGTAARSYADLRAPWFLHNNGSLIKRTNLTESPLMTFRVEFFNRFNRAVFAAPDEIVNSAVFGPICRQAHDPRQGQLALRLEF
jgi:hypothetical protein